jgi:hypothetical protein
MGPPSQGNEPAGSPHGRFMITALRKEPGGVAQNGTDRLRVLVHIDKGVALDTRLPGPVDHKAHAGIIPAIADSACGYAALRLSPEDTEVLP